MDGWMYMWMAWASRFESVILRWIKDSFFCMNDLEDGGKEVSNRLKSPPQVRREYKHTEGYHSSLIRTKSPSPPASIPLLIILRQPPSQQGIECITNKQ